MIIQGENFTIQNIGVSELDDIYQVYQNCEDFLALGPVATASKEMVLEDLKMSQDEDGIYCGIYIGKTIIGVVDFSLCGYEGNPGFAHLSLLMISAAYRDRGIGRKVVNAVEKEIFHNNAVESIFAGVQTNNKDAIRFWTGLGYQIVSDPQLMPDTTITYKLQKERPSWIHTI